MAKKNRKTLKHFFKSGSMPREEHFEDLIDSTLNIRDDGFERTPDHGIKISAVGRENKLLSFLSSLESENIEWSLELKDDDTLVLKRNKHENSDHKQDNIASEIFENDQDVISFSNDGKVGIGNKKPDFALDISGTMSSWGRAGKTGEKEVFADGKWHAIIENLNGCNAFEIIAGTGKEKTGKYSLMHAFAVNAFHDRKKIKYHQAYFLSRCSKIKLRWKGTRNNYRLEIKTGTSFGEDVVIKYNITQLWFDPLMKNCIKK